VFTIVFADSLPSSVPQVLINREPLRHLNFDVELLGDCDVIVNELCHHLGGHFSELCSTVSPATEITAEAVGFPTASTTVSDDNILVNKPSSASTPVVTKNTADNNSNLPVVAVSAPLSSSSSTVAEELTTNAADDIIRSSHMSVEVHIDITEGAGTSSETADDSASVVKRCSVGAEHDTEESLKTNHVNWTTLLKRMHLLN